ncbi:hypothetical protein DMH04_47535 [Kibdelosporangium aridum]|uniref:Uncharacterized protein n=1 Tax=Kibdelosporangium aridum TaxID=2030 RepID=A0A428YKI9_KIBAR|nr:hypothetical protein DMH04_47535 [Kibdelosporangium aridum]
MATATELDQPERRSLTGGAVLLSVSTIPTRCVHRSSTMKFPQRGILLCANGHFGVPEWWTRGAGMVDTGGGKLSVLVFILG